MGLALVLLLVGSALIINRIHSQYSVDQFFPKEHPLLLEQNKMNQEFKLENASPIILILETKSGSWFHKDYFKDLEKISHKISRINLVKNIKSLPQIQLAKDSGKEIKIGHISKIAEFKDYKNVAGSSLLKQFFNISYTKSALYIYPQKRDGKSLEKISQEIRNILYPYDNEIQFYISGIPIIQKETADTIQLELVKFLIASVLGFSLLIFVFYRTVSVILTALGGIILVNLSNLAGLVYLNIPLNALLVSLPILCSICFISLLVHNMHPWAEILKNEKNVAQFSNREILSFDLLCQHLLPNFLSTLTTAIGFLVLASSNIPVIKEYAWVVALSSFWTFILSHLYFYVVMPHVKAELRDWNSQHAWWAISILKLRKPIIIASILLVGTLGVFIPQINFSSKLFDDLAKESPGRKKMEIIDSEMGGSIPMDIVIELQGHEPWLQKNNFIKMKNTLKKVETIPGITSQISYVSLLQSLSLKKSNLAEAAFLFSLDSNDPLMSYLNTSYQKTRLQLRTKDLMSDEIKQIQNSLVQTFSQAFPNSKISVLGVSTMSHNINKEVSQSLVFGFWHSLLLISVLLVFFYGSLKWALIASLPNLLPPIAIAGLLGFNQTSIKPAVALIFSIALGLTFNNTIYFLDRIRRIKKEKGSLGLPLSRAYLIEAFPCLTESAVTLFGFSIFLLSDFRLTQSFGAYMVLAIFAGAIGDLIFLPAFLKMFPKLLLDKNVNGGPMKKLEDKKNLNKILSTDWVDIKAASIFVLFTSLLISSPLKALESKSSEVHVLFEKARKKMESQTEQADIKIRIQESNGDEKIRELKLKATRRHKGYQTKARVMKPLNLRGTTLLAEKHGMQYQQWIYFPSQKQTRRIASLGEQNSSQGILGSELKPEDMDWSSYQKGQAKILKKDKQYTLVEVLPFKKNQNQLRMRVFLENSNNLPTRIDYYRNEKLIKTLKFSEYFLVDEKYFRPKNINIHNLENNRKTFVQLSKVIINNNMDSNEFTIQGLRSSKF